MEYKRARLFLILLAVAGAVQIFVSYVYFSDVAFLRHFLQQVTKKSTVLFYSLSLSPLFITGLYVQ